MSRPLIVTDCDEVLLHMVVPFRDWVDAAHDIHFDLTRGDFVSALRRKACGSPIAEEEVWPLLESFFQTEMHRQYPTQDAVEAIGALSEQADIVILTNIGEDLGPARADQLRRAGIPHRVIGSRGGKGAPLAGLLEEYRPGTTIFIDDLAVHHESVALHAPQVWRLHMVGEPLLAGCTQDTPHAHARIDRWAEARTWIEAILAKEAAAAP